MEGSPQQIGRYRILGELGRGAMGVVYHATDPAIGRSVAIKTIRMRDIDDTGEREKLRERLFREARSAGVLSHPNIVTIYDMDEVGDLAYIAMAFVNGPTLEKILATNQPLSGAKMLRILRQAALALDYAHTRGIVHRDVKPANIMTDEDGSVKITDFGIARLTEGTHPTQTRTEAGTSDYMSPEQVQGSAVDGRSDQFSLAVIAYEILTGERPFMGEHLSTIVLRIMAEEPQPASRLNTTLTPQIDEVLRKGLAKMAEGRFPNCSNFVGALELACAESRGWKTVSAGSASAMPTVQVTAREPIAIPGFTGSAGKKRSAFWLAALSALLVGGSAAFLVNYRSQTGETTEAVVPAAAGQPGKPDEASVPKLPEPHVEIAPEKTTPVDPPAQEIPGLAPVEPVAPTQAPPFRTEPESVPPPAQGKLQSVWATTNPPGAKAVLDGNLAQACQTPCMLHGASGLHRLTVSQAGYLNEYRDVRIGDSAIDIPQIVLRQPMGTLMLSSSPAGATIRVNGGLLSQVTPAVLSLKPGPYSLTVEKDGLSRTEHVDLGDNLVHLSVTLGQ